MCGIYDCGIYIVMCAFTNVHMQNIEVVEMQLLFWR